METYVLVFSSWDLRRFLSTLAAVIGEDDTDDGGL